MKLTNKQSQAQKEILDWIKTPSSPWLRTLDGPAGTGKSTLMGEILKDLPKRKEVILCAPTGKAASVLRLKTKKPVKTIHQLLYMPLGVDLSNLDKLQAQLMDAKAEGKSIAGILIDIEEEMSRVRREDVRFKDQERDLSDKVVICDEGSMVSRNMLRDFERTGAKVLFVGDSYQLPPVKDEAWFNEREHDNRLDEIVRQAADSGIIRLSEQIRTGNLKLEEFKDPTADAWLTHKGELDIAEHWMKADQVLTGKNESRQKANRFFRKQLGRAHSPLPVLGDKMICLKNNHRALPPWINGVQFEVTANVDDPGDGFHWLECLYEGIPSRFEFYPYHCLSTYNSQEKEDPREFRKGLFEADFAYAITVHKSQGSEWPFVLVADDKMMFENKDFRRRWLYTAVTRAKNKVIIAQ